MRPIRLTFAGLRSYREPAEIDFGDLNLFAVIGDTGAGKSTIIEALSLALYARKTWSGGAKLEDLIADGEKTLRVEFTFAAGEHTWTVTRSRHRSTTPGINKLVRLDGGEHVDGADQVTARVAEIIGLDHGQFTRAVVLPQGRFDELLQSRPKERNKLLASILGLDDVRGVGAAADTLAKRYQPLVVEARTRRDALPDDPPAALAAAEAATALAEQRRAELDAAAIDARRLATAVDELTVSQARVDTALTQVPSEGRWVDAIDAAREAGRRLLAERAASVNRATAADAALVALDEEAARTLAGFASRDDAVTARAELAAASTTLASATAELEAADARVADLDAAPPASAIDTALVDAEAQARARLEAATAAARCRDEATAADAAVALARTAAEDASLALDEAATVGSTAATALDRAERRAHDARVASAVSVAVAGHGAGDPCPVCERELPAAFVPPASPDLDAAEHERRAAHDAAAKAAGALAERHAAHDRAQVALDTALADAAARHAALAEMGDLDLAEAQAAAQAARDAITRAEAQLAAAIEVHERDTAAARVARTAAAQRVAAAAAIAGLLPEPWRPSGDVDPVVLRAVVERIVVMLGELDSIERRRAHVEVERQQAATAIAEVDRLAVETVTGPAQKAVTEANAFLARVRDVARAIDVDGPGVVDDDTRTSRLAELVDTARHELDVAASVLAKAEAARAALVAARDAASGKLATTLAGAGFDDVAALQHAAGVAEEKAAGAREAATAAAAHVEEAARLDRVLDVARPFVANLEVLAVALRDQHFVGHLVKAREAELLAEATRRLRAITNGRFGFVSDFGVVSLASGEIRTPDTLSGGERFQAALALALALVEIASRGGGHLDAVFVDEGFGSLDAAALETALSTLATVAGGGRTVALISHLRPVAEYVDTVLHVTKDDMLGSRITTLDAEARDRLLADDLRAGLTA